MSKEILQDIITDFEVDKFVKFFRHKNRYFRPQREILNEYDDESFSEVIKLGEVSFDNEARNLIICAFYSIKSLSERSGKKAQYEKAKKILKENGFDGGIFIFYDKPGNFRFSLIYANYMGKCRDWSTFRRFTYFVGKELTNKTFLQRIGNGDFTSLEKIKEAFSVEKVTKEFYEDIAHWYFWAVEHSRFPKDAQIEENGKNVAVIRLITRMIFIWFMRERGLVPKELFEERNIKQVLKNISPDSSTYYRAILQNLFFATLNTKKEERQFRSEKRFYKGWNKDFGIQYVYRYHDLFADPKKMEEYFGNIPFLNGGLFDCLDDGRNNIYIDGFTERNKEYQPEVPNFLFFSREKKVDLNSYYGTKNKVYKTQGLLNILSSFNFTIDENSPDDADIALDPELLGRVFENLLASFNPETSTTARKATGSYYTPREIVDYMVTESLKAYFKTHLQTVQSIEEKLDNLFSTESEENPFSKSESKKLVELIESVRIIDPAVGSGAFPMGALNKMVFILSKVDSGNELWKQAQLIAAEAIPDSQVRRATKNQIEEFFKDKNADYGRKLYLIQKCIYGVDIQQIAVEIAKLRFFISLLVDEKIDKGKENWGIEPLPNLDFKIMQGNSLISEFLGIDFDNGQTKQGQAGVLFTGQEDSLIKELEQKKIDFQNESGKDKKAKLKNEIEDLMIRIFKIKVRKQKADYFRQMEDIEERYAAVPNKKTREEIIGKEKRKLSQKTGFDLENIERQLREFTSKNKTKPFFAWKLYFAEVFEKGGFDVVIANPPYIEGRQLEDKDLKILKNLYFSAQGKVNLFNAFQERAYYILRKSGISTFIIPATFLKNSRYWAIRKFLLEKTKFLQIITFEEMQFESSIVESIVILVQRLEPQDNKFLVFNNLQYENPAAFLQDQYLNQQDYRILIFGDAKEMSIVNKSKKQSIKLGDVYNVKDGISTGFKPFPDILLGKKVGNKFVSLNGNEENFDPAIHKKIIDGGEFNKYTSIRWEERYIKYDKFIEQNPKPPKGHPFNCQLREKEIFETKPRILSRQTSNRLIMTLDEEGFYTRNSIHNIYPLGRGGGLDIKYILALLNSSLMNFVYTQSTQEIGKVHPQVHISDLKQLPIIKVSSTEQKPFINLVDKILAITKADDYLENPAKQAKVREYENEINQLTYKLYGLTPEEIKIVEGK